MSEATNIEGKVLGKQVEYPQKYAPEILVAVPRHFNREQYAISEDNLPFEGADVWHAYEFSFLTNKGLPVTGVLKIIYPSNSFAIVESKSLKLYLNSFNMSSYGATPSEGLNRIRQIVSNDLSKLLECEVSIAFINSSDTIAPFDFSDYHVLEEDNSVKDIVFNHFTETPELLSFSKDGTTTLNVCTHLLRSNCKITSQPDWGSAYIHLKTKEPVNQTTLLQYLVSFRNENHFHEEVCEMIYKRLHDKFSPDEIVVSCIYTRRGGIDICPTRANKFELLPQHLTNVNYLSQKLLRQ